MSWEFLALFLIELAFIGIIGILYAVFAVVVIAVWSLIERFLYWIGGDKSER